MTICVGCEYSRKYHSTSELLDINGTLWYCISSRARLKYADNMYEDGYMDEENKFRPTLMKCKYRKDPIIPEPIKLELLDDDELLLL